jgi:hypothetical protein
MDWSNKQTCKESAMTQLQSLNGYDPETELQLVRQLVIDAENDCRFYEDTLSGIDDNAVYELFHRRDHRRFDLCKREVFKRTPNQILLTGEHTCDRQACLPREPLDAGYAVCRGHGWDMWDQPWYAFGWGLRQMSQKCLADITSHLEGWRFELQELEQTIAKDRPNWKE